MHEQMQSCSMQRGARLISIELFLNVQAALSYAKHLAVQIESGCTILRRYYKKIFRGHARTT